MEWSRQGAFHVERDASRAAAARRRRPKGAAILGRYVEWYRVEAVESELRLDRPALVKVALLLGSDHTQVARQKCFKYYNIIV